MIIVLYTLSIPYIISKFIKTKKNQEMRVREPNALIFMIVCLWAGTVFKSIWLLQVDPEADYIEIDVIFRKAKWGILSDLQIFCVFAGVATFFYRSWCLLVKTEIVRKVTSHFFVRNGSDLIPDTNMSPSWRTRTTSLIMSTFGGRHRTSYRRRMIIIFSIITALIVSLIVTLGEVNISQNDRENIQRVVLSIIGFIGLIFESWVINHVRDRYGTVSEFKVFSMVGFILMLMTITSGELTNQFWGVLVRYFCWAVTVWLLIVWLYFYIQRFAISQIENSHLQDFKLHHVFRKENTFDRFREFSKLSLCAENVEFFVDIYTIRKNLTKDPWRALVKGESQVIQNCARVSMPWIDDLIADNRDGVPSIERIYELYINPSSEFEVNIPGKLQTKLVASFSSGSEKKPLVELSTLRLPDVQLSISYSEETDKISLTDGRSTYSEEPKHGIVSTFNNSRPSTVLNIIQNISDGQSPTRMTKRSFQELQTERELIELFPVWKELIMLLENDTFIRFKQTLGKEKRGVAVIL